MPILNVATYDEDCLMLVIDDSHFGRSVPIQVGTLHIDHSRFDDFGGVR